MTLAEFLLARIAEDEEVAKRAAFGYGPAWMSETDDAEGWSVVHADGQRDMVGCEDGDVIRHIARHDPARVLAECDAKRRIVEEWQAAADNEDEPYANGLESACLLLALPYAAHSDYDEAWRP